MSDMIFQGQVDESEVGKLSVDMPVSLAVGAIASQRFDGKLEYIAPKGIDKEGTIEFEVRASVVLRDTVFVRANYSATAEIVLERKPQVLSIPEKLVQFEGGKSFVEVETAPQVFERRAIELGISDGIHAEVRAGIDGAARLKVPDPNRGS
jgi:HlyD family secretion protein